MKHAIVLLTLLLWLGARPGVLGAEATVSPYSKWTHGPSADPAFFPIAVWLQSPANASRYRQAGINTYVALWRGPTEEQLAELKQAGLRLICEQNAVALRHLDDPTIMGWMHGDEPDNAQEKAGGGYGPPIAPEKVVVGYQRMRSTDPSRPVMLNLVHQFKPSFREAALLDDAEMLEGVSALNRQITRLAPVLNSPPLENAASVISPEATAPVAFTVRRHQDKLCLFAVAMRGSATSATFTLKGLKGEKSVEAIDEGRSVTAVDGRFQDQFEPWQVHLYRVVMPDRQPRQE
jgi:hypothetical protein